MLDGTVEKRGRLACVGQDLCVTVSCQLSDRFCAVPWAAGLYEDVRIVDVRVPWLRVERLALEPLFTTWCNLREAH